MAVLRRRHERRLAKATRPAGHRPFRRGQKYRLAGPRRPGVGSDRQFPDPSPLRPGRDRKRPSIPDRHRLRFADPRLRPVRNHRAVPGAFATRRYRTDDPVHRLLNRRTGTPLQRDPSPPPDGARAAGSRRHRCRARAPRTAPALGRQRDRHDRFFDQPVATSRPRTLRRQRNPRHDDYRIQLRVRARHASARRPRFRHAFPR